MGGGESYSDLAPWRQRTRGEMRPFRHFRGEQQRTGGVGYRISSRSPRMRASRLALVAAVLAIPSAVYSQDNGLVDGRVGSDLSTSPMQSNPSMGVTGAYRRPPALGHR